MKETVVNDRYRHQWTLWPQPHNLSILLHRLLQWPPLWRLLSWVCYSILRWLHTPQGSSLPWASSLGSTLLSGMPASKKHPWPKVVGPLDEGTTGTGLGFLPWGRFSTTRRLPIFWYASCPASGLYKNWGKDCSMLIFGSSPQLSMHCRKPWILNIVEDSNLSTIYDKWVTIIPKDMHLARCIRVEAPIQDAAPSYIIWHYKPVRKGKAKCTNTSKEEQLEADSSSWSSRLWQRNPLPRPPPKPTGEAPAVWLSSLNVPSYMVLFRASPNPPKGR